MPRLELDLATLEDSKPIRCEVEGTGVVVVRTGENLYAFEDTCPHAGWRLSEGELVDGRIECPGHGWQFGLSGGECADVPAYRLKPVRVTREGDRVVLEL